MTTITGNLLDVTSGTILHQVNCFGVTGGLAGVLARKWESAFDPYHEHCEAAKRVGDVLGSFILGNAEPGLFIGHVFGQCRPGPNTDMAAVRQSLGIASLEAIHGPVYAPFKMGCGIGGGNWPEYLEILTLVFPDIIIVQRPEDAK